MMTASAQGAGLAGGGSVSDKRLSNQPEKTPGRRARRFSSVDDDALWLPAEATDRDAKAAAPTSHLQSTLASVEPTEALSDRNAITDAQERQRVLAKANLTKPDDMLRFHQRVTMRTLMAAQGGADLFHAAIRLERDRGTAFNMLPALLGGGIGLWYLAPSAPALWVVVCAAILSGLLASRLSAGGLARMLCIALTAILLGMALAGLQLERANMPIPQSELTGQISGTVIAVDSNQRGNPRYLIKPVSIEGLTAEELPARIRLTGRATPRFVPGNRIEGLARLQPFSGPIYPGGYDFAYRHYLHGLALTGFFMGSAKAAQPRPANAMNSDVQLRHAEWLRIRINQARLTISQRITANLAAAGADPGIAAVAAALVTGDRSAIPAETQESLRKSGLAHILAISGLHMALVTLTVIWLSRSLFALSSTLVDRYPIRKFAVVGGFFAATGYLMLSGGSVATQRAWIMICVMLTASLLDRQAITMRSVAVAALIVLIIAPSSLFDPGFQMSFAAAASLVAVYGIWTRYRVSDMRAFEADGWLRKGGGYFVSLAATSLIAGMATGIFAAWHFHRVAALGLLSNLAAMPLVSIAVMPLCLASVLLMPFGFEQLALRPAAWAISMVVAASNWVNGFGADFETGRMPVAILLVAAISLFIFCAFTTRLRLFGIGLLFLIPLLPVTNATIPEVLVSQDGRTIAHKRMTDEGRGTLVLVGERPGRFAADIWRRAYFPNADFGTFTPAKRCDREWCDFDLAQTRVVIVRDPSLIENACGVADILIAPRLWFLRCKDRTVRPRLMISRKELERFGSHAIVRTKTGYAVETAWPDETAIRRFGWQARFDNVERRFERSKTRPISQKSGQ